MRKQKYHAITPAFSYYNTLPFAPPPHIFRAAAPHILSLLWSKIMPQNAIFHPVFSYFSPNNVLIFTPKKSHFSISKRLTFCLKYFTFHSTTIRFPYKNSSLFAPQNYASHSIKLHFEHLKIPIFPPAKQGSRAPSPAPPSPATRAKKRQKPSLPTAKKCP